MGNLINDLNDPEYRQKLAGPKADVEWRLRNAGLLSLITFLVAAGLVALFLWLFLSYISHAH